LSAIDNKADLKLLALGAFVGLAVAAFGILQRESSKGALPENAVARVNDALISRDLYDRALSRSTNYAGQRVEGDNTMMLQRLIDEELLIQRGIELGMVQSDAAVRQAVIDSLIASVTAEADAASPTDEELSQYLRDNPERFSYISKVSVEAWQTDNESSAQEFNLALRTGGVVASSEDMQLMPDLPSELMSLEILGTYLGPGIAAAAAEMPEGSSAVFARRGRWLVVRVRQKERSSLTDLNTVRSRVLIDFRRNLADTTLRDYIEGLRQRASITVAKQ
jgi:hypothetical protein